MSQLSGRQSLRDIQSNLEAQSHKLYHLGAKPIARSTLSRINENQPASLYEALFHKLLTRLQSPNDAHKFRFKNPPYSLDASIIGLSTEVFPWAEIQKTKAGMKLSVGLNHGSHIPEFVAIDNGIENDMIQGRRFKFPKGGIVAFDKGYVDYKWFKSLTDQGVFFVTRIMPKSVSRIVDRCLVNKGTGVTSDQTESAN